MKRNHLPGTGLLLAAGLIMIALTACASDSRTAPASEPGTAAMTGAAPPVTDPTVRSSTSNNTTRSTTTAPPSALPAGFYWGRISGVDTGPRTMLLTITRSCRAPDDGTWTVDLRDATFTYNATPQSGARDLTFEDWHAMGHDGDWGVSVGKNGRAALRSPNSVYADCEEMLRAADR
jgi:hypothetical protein